MIRIFRLIVSYFFQKGNEVMNNQRKDANEFLAAIDQPKSRVLRCVARWTNSTLGMILEIIAIVAIIALAATDFGKTNYLQDLISLVAAIYILVYELFDLCVFGIAVDKYFCWGLIAIGHLLLIGVLSVSAIMYLGTVKWYPIINLICTVLICWLEVTLCDMFVDTDCIDELKSAYIKEKFSQSKFLKLMYLYFMRKKEL